MCRKYTLILAFLGLFGTNSLADSSLCFGQNTAAKEKHVKACCVVTAVDPQAGKVSVRETATGCTFQFEVSQKSQIERFRPGQPVDKGQGAASTTSCGSNVGRNENTKTAPCRVYTQDHGWVPCK